MNDKVGNPIMIGLVMVWKVRDTYKVMFNIDNEANAASSSTVANTSAARMKTYENFVKIQADAKGTACIAREYAYDNGKPRRGNPRSSWAMGAETPRRRPFPKA